MKLLDELEKYFEAKGDQDGDKDQDFADIMIARMVASGMSKDDAISGVYSIWSKSTYLSVLC